MSNSFKNWKKAFEICSYLEFMYDIEPLHIAKNKYEDDIDIYYKEEDLSLAIEIGIDEEATESCSITAFEIAALVNNNKNKKILYSEDVEGMNFREAVEVFVKDQDGNL